MNASKRKNRKVLEKIINKSKKNIKNISKKIKNKTTLTRCNHFCKNDYMVKMNKLFKRSSDKMPTKEDDEFAYNTCKKTFCNEGCIGYDFFGDKQKQLNFKKSIINGFQNTYTKDRIKRLRKKGVISGCVDVEFV